ncbi:unnamed protein product [Brachionus calyciflorus]|uniref:Uncharacterized protein n=1 Tax=Brachionus calyciflorus TaxID=104777 RepID=A0A814J3V7_9BILA|nr:unnamed protein product [Brachionus calyciflorus]
MFGSQDTSIGQIFNAWIGKNISYVANAYPSNVYVLFTGQDISIKKIDITTNGLVVDTDRDKIESNIKIVSKDFYKYSRKRLHEYMTVIDCDNANNVICKNHLMTANRSYVITSNGQIKTQSYGSNNLFLDEHGRDHS